MPKIKKMWAQLAKLVIIFFISHKAFSQYIEPPTNREPLPPIDVVPSLPPDIVKSLKAQISPRDPNTVILTWQAPPIRDDYIVARSSLPIASIDLLLAARSIAVLPSGVNTYLDQGLEPGSYYYAVVARSQVRERKVVLALGENYTGSPVVILQKPVEERKEIPPPQVSLILAQPENDGIRLSWKGVSTPGVSYVVYRANIPFSDPEVFQRLTPLVILGQGQEVYFDKDLPGPGTYYYAVVTRSPTGAQDLRLQPDQSYTRYGVEWGTIDLPTVKNLKAVFNKEKKEVELNWQDIEAKEDTLYYYEIYRFQDPLLVKQIEKAEKRGKVPLGIENFRDKLPEIGNYYYAVVTRLQGKNQMSQLILGENLVLLNLQNVEPSITPSKAKDVEKEPQKNVYFENFSLKLDQYAVFLSWKTTKNIFEKGQIFLYRFNFPPKSLADLANGELIARLSREQEMYEDVPPKKGVFYYAIFGQASNGGLLPDFLEWGQNLAGPIYFEPTSSSQKQPTLESDVVKVNEEAAFVSAGEEEKDLQEIKPKVETKKIAKKDFNDNHKALREIIEKYYKLGQYRETVFHLSSFLKEDNNIKATALFYIGLSYYHLGDYRKAIDYFINPQVVKAYGKKAKFWYDRSLEKLE